MYAPPPSLYPFESRHLDVGGHRMHYLDEGPRDAPPVVMVHGNPSWSFYFRNVVLALRDRYRCIVPDHIGMGLSDKPNDTGYSYHLAQRIEHVMHQRREGIIPEARICDSRFQDLMDDPIGCVEKIYGHFDLTLTPEASKRMDEYLASKPREKFGAHRYTVGADEISERRFFRKYQQTYDVPDEV